MKRLILVGSPRSNGRSAHLAEMLFEANIDECPEDELFLVPVSESDVAPCIGCGACREKTPVTFKGDGGAETTELRHRCVFDDDMQAIYDLLDDADELIVVSPVYFSGAPAPMKCVLDRMQPYFWVNQFGRDPSLSPDFADAAGTRLKRPATLHVIGEGGDPHGFAPLVSEVKSALACAGFRLERVLSWVGKIDANGEIQAEPEEVKPSAQLQLADGALAGSQPGAAGNVIGSRRADGETDTGGIENPAANDQPGLDQASASNPANARTKSTSSAGAKRTANGPNAGERARPKLDISSGRKPRQSDASAQNRKSSSRKSANRKSRPSGSGKQSSRKGGRRG